jgi:hypothetical protein
LGSLGEQTLPWVKERAAAFLQAAWNQSPLKTYNFYALQRFLRFGHKNCRQSDCAGEFELAFVTRHQQIGATSLRCGNMKDIKRAAEEFPCMKAGQMGCAVPNDRPIQHFHG